VNALTNGKKCNFSKMQPLPQEPLFTDFSYRNTGIKWILLNDYGRMRITVEKKTP
jgi:hypothetical protein